jgi:methionine sulfoxide reductase heme-binding subunit
MSAGLSSAAWDLARGTGLVSLILLSLVMTLGIATRSRRPIPLLPRFAVTQLHRSASLLAVVLLAVHVGTLLMDPYANLRVADLLVPFTASYRPLWVGLGTLTLDLLVALVVTSLLRHRLGPRVWRTVHWAAYAAWPIALLHGLGSGSDAGTLWMRAVALACCTAVGAAVCWRFSSETFQRPASAPTRSTIAGPHRGTVHAGPMSPERTS